MLVSYLGAHQGLRATIPTVLGVSFGSPAVFCLVWFGLMDFFQIDEFRLAYKVICTIYLLYLAYVIVATTAIRDIQHKTIGFWAGFFFQFINPKIWTQYALVAGIYLTGEHPYAKAALVFLIFMTLGLINGVVWAFFGQKLSGVLSNKRFEKLINVVFSIVLLAVTLPHLTRM